MTVAYPANHSSVPADREVAPASVSVPRSRGIGWETLRAQTVSLAIWVLLPLIFLIDVLTPADHVSLGFAYAVPIFLSLLETEPRWALYACLATALTLIGAFIHPPTDASMIVVLSNRVIAVVTQWLVATLVRLHHHRLVDAQDKAEYQRRFLDILSHEVGTALTTVSGQAYRLNKLSEQIAPTDLRLRAEKIRQAAERIQGILDRIQFASSLGDGLLPTGRESIDLRRLITRMADQLREEQRARPIELALCAEPQVVTGDEMLLIQVFENVINNSLKYSAPAAPISIALDTNGGAVRVTIADKGRGIPPHELAKIRTPYYRGENSKGISGAGLGFYVVERIVESHRGKLSIESDVGVGTKVIIDLPRSNETAKP